MESLVVERPAMKNVQHDFDVDEGHVATTVRVGIRWQKRARQRDHVDLWECSEPHSGECLEDNCTWRGTAQIIGYWEGPIKYIPSELLAIEHEKECRDLGGLMRRLKRAYGSSTCVNDLCTVLIYERLVRC